MLKLMKYELYRRKTLLISVIITMLALEAIICFGIYKGGGSWGFLSVALTFVALVGGLLFPFADTVINYYSDFKNKHGYMLFLTPNKGIKIIGSKALFALIELVVMISLIVGSAYLSLAVLKHNQPLVYNSVFQDIFDGVKKLLNVYDLTFWSLLPLILVTILQYFNGTMIAVMSITISKTVLSKNNFNWLFALLIFFVIGFGVQTLNTTALLGFGFANDMINIIETNVVGQLMKYVYVGVGIYTFWITASITVSSILLNKRTDL